MNKIILSIAAAAALAACAGGGASNPLKGHEFATMQDGTRITLNFDKENPRLFGKVVNNYNAQYEVAGDNLIVSKIASTMMMPIGNAAKTEHEYFKFLGGEEPKAFSLSGGTLTISDHSGKSIKFDKIK